MYAIVICTSKHCEPNRIFRYLKHELRKSFVKFSDKMECFLNEVCVKLLPNFVREGKNVVSCWQFNHIWKILTHLGLGGDINVCENVIVARCKKSVNLVNPIRYCCKKSVS